jgi:hypothetical protein
MAACGCWLGLGKRGLVGWVPGVCYYGVPLFLSSSSVCNATLFGNLMLGSSCSCSLGSCVVYPISYKLISGS